MSDEIKTLHDRIRRLENIVLIHVTPLTGSQKVAPRLRTGGKIQDLSDEQRAEELKFHFPVGFHEDAHGKEVANLPLTPTEPKDN